jgi:hypothetical protein
MDVVDKLYDGYGEEAQQGMIQEQGAAYLKKNYPMMDFVKTAVIFDPAAPPAPAATPAKPAVAKPVVPAKPAAVKPTAVKPAAAPVKPPAAKQ